jgi:hypothetical protein
VKCTVCERALGLSGNVITLVSPTSRVYTATLHPECLADLIGITNRRKLDRVCLDSGWTQTGLPGLGDVEEQPPLTRRFVS